MVINETENSIPTPKSSSKVLNILLVEDNEGDIRLTKEALKESNFESELNVVKDGVEALSYLNKEGEYHNKSLPDLILLDLNLPKKNGIEVLESIKMSEDLKSIPIIILTTSSSNSDILKTYNLYANCFITKPVDFDDFIYIVKCIEEFWIDVVKLPSLNM